MNKTILVGRLTRDPDIRYTQSENSRMVASYTLAVDRRRVNSDGTRDADFIRCVAFDRQAEFAERYLHQGMKIGITGRIQTGSYTNSEGQKVYTTDVIIEEQEFMESKAVSQRSQETYQQREQAVAYTPKQEQETVYTQEGFGEGFMNIPDGDEYAGLPFR